MLLNVLRVSIFHANGEIFNNALQPTIPLTYYCSSKPWGTPLSTSHYPSFS